jgi:hypothetical protein
VSYLTPNPWTTWNGGYCPTCGKPVVHMTWTSTSTQPVITYKPKHRKEGPAQ